MKPIIALIVFSILFASQSFGQDQPTEQKPATKLEAFKAKTGIVTIKGYTKIGSVGSTGTVTVNAQEVRDASNSKGRITGISIEVKEYGRLERENTALIDSDEIDSLIAGIDYISKATKDVTTQKSFEVEYRTKGHFSITVFNSSNGDISVAVSAGYIGKTTAFMDFDKIADLRQLIIQAKANL